MSALAHADLARLEVSPTLDKEVRSQLGQFMTPAGVATFMASLLEPLPEDVRLLDAGAGMGALTAAVVQRACAMGQRGPRSISVTAFEVDAGLASKLETTLAACAADCRISGIAFTGKVVRDDYIVSSSEPLLSAERGAGHFNCAILNPPYAKINLGSTTRGALSKLGIETSNLYTAFVAVALQQLESQSRLVAITPRSFCNGTYFEHFRKRLLREARLDRFHLYESRRDAFQDDEVLQENVVFALTKGAQQGATVAISSSQGAATDNVPTREVPFGEIVHPNDSNAFFRLATSVEESELALRVRSLPETLSSLGITVSTGRVVDFRAKDALRSDPGSDTVPLIYPAHFEGGYVAWPKLGGRKANALAYHTGTHDLTVPRGTYVLTKRFTSKEERRRIVAALFDPDRVDAERIGFENHLNYFHERGGGLPPDLARGLALFLNSTAVDQYFRQFSGHTQVNATDLRSLHYPTASQLRRLGSSMLSAEFPCQDQIDDLVEPLLPERLDAELSRGVGLNPNI